METHLADFIRDTPEGREAESILRKCVHCGFCTATCPTYQLLGDELDGPRGRIYLIKQVLEGEQATARTRLHLDRCLTCRACETTCPSGVRYGRLVDIGRAVVESQAPRPAAERAIRAGLRAVLPHRDLFGALLKVGQAVRPAVPGALGRKIPLRRRAGPRPTREHARRVVTIRGCVQQGIAPDIDAGSERVLDALGISLRTVEATACCGAVEHHLSAHESGLAQMRRNVDALWPQIEAGAEAVVVTASACAAMVKEYGELLADDPAYAEKAARISSLARDLGEVIAGEDLGPLRAHVVPRRVAFHSPCTLQHGQKLPGLVEGILTDLGFELTPVAEAHLCCGSAGTYSVLQPLLSEQLLARKLSALEAGEPELIATANIGCLTHLQSGTGRRVVHWIRLLDPHA